MSNSERTRGHYATYVALAALLAAALALRTYNLDWDRGHYFHPDERQILMVAEGLSWPRDPALLLSPTSPLNPHFFAYGSFPIYLLRGFTALAQRGGWGWAVANRATLLGRLISALFDTFTVLATYLLGRKAFDRRTGLLAALLITFGVLHIQLSHFYTVDTLVTPLILLAVSKAVDVARRGQRRDGIWLGLLLGMALATKVSVLPLLVVALVAWLIFAWPGGINHSRAQNAGWSADSEDTENSVSSFAPLPEGARGDPVGARNQVSNRRNLVSAHIHRIDAENTENSMTPLIKGGRGDQLRAVVRDLRSALSRVGRNLLLTFVVAALCFLLLEPYALIDASSFVKAIAQEMAMGQGIYDFPYTRQYAGTWSYVYQIWQILLFALGVPLGLLGLGGLLGLCRRVWRRPWREGLVLLTWPVLYGLMQGGTYAKFIRYMLPLLPFLCLAGVAMWLWVWDSRVRSGRASAPSMRSPLFKWLWLALLVVVICSTVFYAIAFLNVYRQPHPWLQATAWLCENVPARSTILTEYWDDPLPIGGSAETGGCTKRYNLMIMDFHTLDTGYRLEELLDALEASDYIVISSQRLYGALPRSPEFFPMAIHYYQALFAERLGFQLVAAPAVYPQWAGITLLDNPRAGLSLPTPPLLAASRPSGLVLDLGRADESFTVYDHPQPLIFRRVERLPREELEPLLALRDGEKSWK